MLADMRRKVDANWLIGSLILAAFALAIVSHELESWRASAITECLDRYFQAKANGGNVAAQTVLNACKAHHGLDTHFRWSNPALHLLSFPACKYQNGWSGNCLR